VSARTIPAQQILICDRCGTDDPAAFHNGAMHIRNADCWSRSPNGDSGGALLSFDFCTECSRSFGDWKDAGRKEGAK
jgi:hypothetical protein